MAEVTIDPRYSKYTNKEIEEKLDTCLIEVTDEEFTEIFSKEPPEPEPDPDE